MTPATDAFAVIELLVRSDIDFIVVGMTAGVLQGAPAVTFDLDILYSTKETNIERLLGVLEELEAEFRTDDRHLKPNLSHLRTRGHKLLVTKLGIVDVLGALEDRTYEDLLADSLQMDVGDFSIRVLSLEKLIHVKKRAGRPKDLAVIPLLESTLARRRERSD